ncbi:MAG: cofactor-independent phosphoglycerate mutase [Bacillota bacterium]|nr:MAG: cofactor-independent phosphoglycerate mutase [Bacillota bacterium]
MKYVVILGDGMADFPIAALNGETPLERAYKPNIDALARVSEVGLCKTVPDGMPAGSDVANLSVLGYDPAAYYTGRSPLEAASIGIALKETDLTLRANLVTLSGGNSYETMTMTDYSAGEISSAEAKILVEYLAERLGNDSLKLYAGVSYRHCLVVENGENDTKFTPPHDISGRKIADYLPKGAHAELYFDLMKRSFELLKDHPVNKKRVQEGKNPATSLWFWGAGKKPKLDLFKEKFGKTGTMISAVDLLKGIGKLTGMNVPDLKGATGNYHTDFGEKARTALQSLDSGSDFCYIHIEAPDECGHQGDTEHKIWSVEQIDEKVVGFLKTELEKRGEPFSLLVMPDHPTPIAVKTHVSDPVPYLLYRSGETQSGAALYSEKAAKATGIYVERGCELMKKFLNVPLKNK